MLAGFVRLGQQADGLGNFGMHVAYRRDQFLAHPIRRAQLEFLVLLVEHINGAGLGGRELCRIGDDGGQDSFEIDGRIHRLGDVAERTQLLDRARQLARPPA